MKRFFSPAFVALGIATLCLLAILGPLLSPSHTVIFHTSPPVASLFSSVLFDLFALWAFFTALLLLAQKPGRCQFMIWLAIILALPRIVLKNTSMLMGFRLLHWVTFVLLSVCLGIFVWLSLSWSPRQMPAFERVRRFFTVVFVFVALNGVVIIGQLLWYRWQVRNLNAPAVLHQRSISEAHGPAHARVIWILFDELSYQQLYEQRFPGLALPAFDALARQSTVFTHVVPAGAYTEDVIPSLLTGWPVDRIRVSSNGRQLSLHNPVTGAWKRFDQHQTVFQDALNDGYSTAVAGWYNPYCRILPQVLDRCVWSLQFPYPGDLVPGQSPLANARTQIVERLDAISALLLSGHRQSDGLDLDTKLHVADFVDLRAAADSMLNDSAADFLFLHMPIPHPLGIYDRHRGVLTTRSTSYIDNLALTDKYLAHVRTLLEQRGEWNSSIIVIMGDHSWRTSFIWSKMEGWTPEDNAASHGAQFDDRPGYIVKLPDQQQGARIDTPFKAIHTRALLDKLLTHQLSTPDALNTWTKQQK
jgi:hypothetical protein